MNPPAVPTAPVAPAAPEDLRRTQATAQGAEPEYDMDIGDEDTYRTRVLQGNHSTTK